jgi:1-phosphofructokinase family hexose kinase
MIRVVGANPAMDRVALWPGLVVGGVNRATEVTVMAGGKSLNLARAVRALGEEVAAYGFLGGRAGEVLRDTIAEHGIVDRHTPIIDETRICFVVVDPEAGHTTMLNEPGPQILPEEVVRFLRDLRADCETGDIVILSGSLPDSVDPAVAAEIIAIGNEVGARTVADIHSQALEEAVSQRPWMVKCNRDELAGLLGIDVSDPGELERYRAQPLPALAGDMQRLRETGIEIVAVTLGEGGAMLSDEDGCLHVAVPRVQVINATGSGDVFLAGLVVGLERGQRARQAITLGAVCGTVAATRLPAQLPPDFDPAEWLPRLTVEPVEPGP